MSFTKFNFDKEFSDRTIADAEFHEREATQETQFNNLPELMVHLNELRGVGLTATRVPSLVPGNPERAVLKGRYKGMVYTEQNQTLCTIISIIELYRYIVLKKYFVEEDDEKFTNLCFTIKNQ